MNFRPMFRVGSSDPGFYGNAQVFATAEEALASANARMFAWTMCTGVRVDETESPVTYAWVNEENVMVNREPKA